MDAIDRKLLTVVQEDFPLVARPFAALAGQLGVSEDEVLARLCRLKEEGIIRRIGAIFDSKQMGYYSTLCAMTVPEDRLDEVAGIINAYPGVTHNYLRQDEFNIWFTLIAPSLRDAEAVIASIEAATGLIAHNLPAERFFKVRVNFPLAGEEDEDAAN